MIVMGRTPDGTDQIPEYFWDDIDRERVAEVYCWDQKNGTLPPAALRQASRLGLDHFLGTPEWLREV